MGIGSKFGITAETGNNIQTDGLVFYVDAAYKKSYPRGTQTFNLASGSLTPTGSFIDDINFVTQPISASSWQFDGVDEWIEFGDVLDLGTNSMTIGTWVKGENTGALQTVVSKAKAAAQDFRFSTFLTDDNPPKISAFMHGDGGADIIPETSSTFAWNTWYYLVSVWDRSSSIKIYVNGVDQSLSGGTTISQWDGEDFQHNNPFRIGSYTASNNTGVWVPFRGLISAVHMYHRVLSSKEILQNFNAGKDRFNL